MAETRSEPDGRTELIQEAATMALYVSICLLAALAAVREHADAGHVDVLRLVWRTTLGLVLAHWFAFRLSARLFGRGEVSDHDATAAVAQFAAAAVAVLATIPVLVLPSSVELDVDRLLLSGLLAAVGYTVARSAGASRRRSLAYGLVIVAVATAVALAKNILSGH